MADPAVAERAFVSHLGGDADGKIAGKATIKDGKLHFEGGILSADGTREEFVKVTGDPASAESVGTDAAKELLAKIGDVDGFIGEGVNETIQDYLEAALKVAAYLPERLGKEPYVEPESFHDDSEAPKKNGEEVAINVHMGPGKAASTSVPVFEIPEHLQEDAHLFDRMYPKDKEEDITEYPKFLIENDKALFRAGSAYQNAL
jgi:hypothetical protein